LRGDCDAARKAFFMPMTSSERATQRRMLPGEQDNDQRK
jgi:hypothetical protein